MKSSKYPFQEFSSLDELASLIDATTKGWDTKWYRGLKTPDHTLLPRIFREDTLSKREGYISVEFRRRARSQLSAVNTPFDWLCAMQHYGLPTRLLDWTESLSVALYFTVRPVSLDLLAPTIWVWDPFELSRLSFPDSNVIPIATDINAVANADIAFAENSDELKNHVTDSPPPVLTDFIFQRLASQNGCFTIHGKDNRSLDEMIPADRRNVLHKFVAKRNKVADVWKSLDLLIPSSDAIFPDIEGMKDYIV